MDYDLGRATEQEIIALRQLIHRAVLHSGMDAAEAATHWNRRLIAAMQMAPAHTNGAAVDSKEAVQ